MAAPNTPPAFFLRIRSPPHSPRLHGSSPPPPEDLRAPSPPRRSARPSRAKRSTPAPTCRASRAAACATRASILPLPERAEAEAAAPERKRKRRRERQRPRAEGRAPRVGAAAGRGMTSRSAGMRETRAGEEPRVCRTVALFENPARSRGPPPSARGFNGCRSPAVHRGPWAHASRAAPACLTRPSGLAHRTHGRPADRQLLPHRFSSVADCRQAAKRLSCTKGLNSVIYE